MSKQQGVKPANYSMSNKMRVALSAAFIFVLMLSLSFRDARRAAAQEKDKRAEPAAAQPAVPPAAAPVDEVGPLATTQVFANNTPINITNATTATPYPSTINVSGVTVNTVTRVQVTLSQFTHTFPDDVDVILVGPQGQQAVLMSDAGGDPNISGVSLTFSQTSANTLPDEGPLVTGTSRPANYFGADGTDTFPAPGPGTSLNAPADLSVFNLTNPNGEWNLYVVDDAGGDVGSIAGGWTLSLTVPTVFTVNSTADTTDGACTTGVNGCTLREAIALAGNGDLINFSSLFNTPQTINLTTALPDIDNSVTIQGTGANLLAVRRDYNAATNFRVFTITTGVSNVAISGLTISNGRIGDAGGGINSQSNLTLTHVHVTGNQADFGGGVFLAADGVFTNCTFSGNTARFGGGGISYQGNGGHTLRLTSSTVSGNTTGFLGFAGGILNACSDGSSSRLEVVSTTIANNTAQSGGGVTTNPSNGSTATTTLRNSIIAGNTPNDIDAATSGGGVSTATVTTQGFNLASDGGGGFLNGTGDKTGQNPLLGPLSLIGGQTPTHALLAGSPALDAGNSSGLSLDQRGVARAFDTPGSNSVSDGADIGAVEMQSIIVTNNLDSGTGSLREAITAANANGAGLDDIIFDNTFFNTARAITLTTGDLFVNTSLTINGTGANLLTISGNNASRVFTINFNITVSLSGMTITGGNGTGGLDPDDGGGIFNLGNLTISNANVTSNTASFGGGIYTQTALTVTDSTISGNHSSQAGGGIFSIAGTVALNRSTVSGNTAAFRAGGLNLEDTNGSLTNSTISGNQSGGDGGGVIFFESFGGSFALQVTNCTIANNSAASNNGAGIVTRANGATALATTTLRNTVIANNSLPNLRKLDIGGMAAITSQGFNLASDDSSAFLNNPTTDKNSAFAGLAPLAANGGPTQTHALLGGSAALDAGNGSGATTDQRGVGFPRAVDLPIANATGGDGTDIGAYEAQTAPPPAISINDVTQSETNSGTTNFNFTVMLSAANAQPVTVSYQTANGTATAGSDYTAIGATTLTFNAGETSKQVSVSVTGDMTVEPDETFFVNLSNPTNATINDNQGQGTIVNDDSAPTPATFAFSVSNFNVNETDPRATVTVIRTGDSTASATVDYRTQDTDTFTLSCANVVNNQGGAFGRCDFATTVGTLAFASGQTQQQFTVPIINDVHVEGSETFTLQLRNATGASLGTPSVATVTIMDNDTTAGQPNPVFEPNPANTARTIPFFVRQQYLDFLSREPEPSEPWSGVLNRCLQLPGGDPQNINNLNPNSPSAGCDRIIVSQSFFGSQEFQIKGFYVFRFYKLAYNRLPEYSEIIPDMSFVAGQTAQEVFARKAQLVTLFTGRPEFVSAYGSLSNAQYINALLARYQLTQITTPDPANPDGTVKLMLTNSDLLNRLNAGTLTRAQVFRAIADSDEVNAQEFNNAFVGMQYYGYLRRTPDASGYDAWLRVLTNPAIDPPVRARLMIDGFMNSTEYRLRFGQQ